MALRRRTYLNESNNRPVDRMKPAAYPYGDADDGLRKMAGHGNSTLQWGNATKDKHLPLSDFDDVNAGNSLRYDAQKLSDDIYRKGLKGGPGQRVIVIVDSKGKARVGEGNHRIHALRLLLKEGKIHKNFPVPTMVFYKGNSDLNSRAWVPKSMR